MIKIITSNSDLLFKQLEEKIKNINKKVNTKAKAKSFLNKLDKKIFNN